MRKYHAFGCACLACMGFVVLPVETAHMSHAVACFEQRSEPDFGPPEGCNVPGQPHGRNVSITTLTTPGTSSASISYMLTSVVFDADDNRLDLQPPFTTEESGPAPSIALSFFDADLVRKIVER